MSDKVGWTSRQKNWKMNSAGKISVDMTDFNKMVENLNAKEIKRAIRQPLNKVARTYRNSILSSMHSTGYNISAENDRYISKKAFIYPKEYDGKSGARAAISKTRKPGAKAYVLKFLNAGTIDRRTKKGYYRGKIQATNFFDSGANAVNAPAEEELKKAVEDQIVKIYNKKNP